MREIEVNNQRKIVLQNKKNGIEVIAENEGCGIDYSYIIPDDEIIMLLNYYMNCKHGYEESDYIHKGKVINTNELDENDEFYMYVE